MRIQMIAKRFRTKLLTALILLLACIGIVGCAFGDAVRKKEVSIEQSVEYWEVTDTKLNGLPQDANICGVTEDGVYYCQSVALDYESGRALDSYHFLSVSGEDTLIYQEEIQHYHGVTYINGTDILLATPIGEELKVLELSADGDVKEIFRQSAVQYPFIQATKEWLVTIRNNWGNNHEYYEESLVLSNASTGEEKTIYVAKMLEQPTGGRQKGEDITCASLGDREVLFAVEEYDGESSQYRLYTYSIPKDEVKEKASLENGADFAVGIEDMVILSDIVDGFPQETGSIGMIVDNRYQELEKVPLIQSNVASNRIFDSLYTKAGFFLSSGQVGYFWDVDSNVVYVHEFDQTGLGTSITEQGFLQVVEIGDEFYVRAINIK